MFAENDEVIEVKTQLAELARLSDNWESAKLENEKTIETMRQRCSEFEIIESGKEMLESRVEMLELELEETESEQKECQQRYSLILFSIPHLLRLKES